jgi:leucyl aminopeptidase
VVAAKEKPDAIVDLATLTGAARVALGSLYACVVGTDQPLIDALIAAGQAAGEPLWQLPLVPEYRDDLRSAIADLKNVGGGGEAGTILGGLFLREFVGDVPWAHLDIAGTAFAERELAVAPRGATGYGVRLLVEYVRRLGA